MRRNWLGITGLALLKAMGGRPIIAHKGIERAITPTHNAGLDIAGTHQWPARVPGLTPIITDRH